MQLKLNDYASCDFSLTIQCPECGETMSFDKSGNDSWNESCELCVITVICKGCKYSGSVHVRMVNELKYGCYCDLEPHMKPDDCVIDKNEHHLCSYAEPGMKKEQCQYWRPIEG